MRAGISRRELGLGAGALCLAGLSGTAQAAKQPRQFLIGADISWIPQDEAAGATYYEGGVARDPLAIFRDAGFNAIKVRLFVDPAKGYSRNKPDSPWCGLEQTIAYGKRIKAAGFHFSLTFHYSDTWADPQKQEKPAAWAGLPFSRLADAVHRHTADSLAALKAAGAAPDLVVIGNETTFGMLWPEGRVPLTVSTGNPVTDKAHTNVAGAGGIDRFAELLKAGISGAHSVLPHVPIAVHNHLGRHWPIVQDWTDKLIERGVRFDVLGLSCYQQAAEGDWERTFTEFARRHPKIGVLVLEYSSRKRYLNDLVHANPNGWGSFIWEPTRHQEAIFLKDGANAGEGPKPNLISQGLNAAEAPGGAAPAGAAPPAPPAGPPLPRRPRNGGRYDADPNFIDLYKTMAKDYDTPKPGTKRRL